MSNLRIATAALRWHAAKEVRLAIGRRKRKAAEAARGATVFNSQYGVVLQLEKEFAEARRMERVAQRALAKECSAARGQLESASDGANLPKLSWPDIIDV